MTKKDELIGIQENIKLCEKNIADIEHAISCQDDEEKNDILKKRLKGWQNTLDNLLTSKKAVESELKNAE